MSRISGLASCAAVLVLGFVPPSEASVLFTATETSAASITQTATLGNVFSFGYEDTQIHGGCSDCLAASASDGSPLGAYGFSVVSGPFNYITDPAGIDGYTQSAIPMDGSYFEHYAGYGTFLISAPSGTALLGGANNFLGVSVWATPGSTTATMEFDLNGFATSDVLGLPSGPLYLDITGTTSSPVGLSDLTPSASPDFMSFTDPLTIDFTVTLTDTPFSPSAPPPPPVTGVPEPGTAALFAMLALGVLGFARRTGAAT